MKYFAFGGSRFYPEGGANDFVGVYDELLPALNVHLDFVYHEHDDGWANVATFDGEKFTIIADWYLWNVGAGWWWKVGEYPDAQYFKTVEEVVTALEANDAS